MERKLEVTNPIAVALLVILAFAVMTTIVLTNSMPFISSGIKLGHNTDSAFMLVNARAGDKVIINYDVDVFNGSLEIEFLQGAFILSAEKLWDIELEAKDTIDSATIIIPEDGIYQVHVQEYSYAGIYNIHWTVTPDR